MTGLFWEKIPKVMTSRRKRLWESISANLIGGCNTEVYTKSVNATILHFFMKVAHTSLFTLHLRYKLWFEIRWWKMTYYQADYVWKLKLSKMAEGTQVVTSLSSAYMCRLIWNHGDGHQLKHTLGIWDGFACETTGRLASGNLLKPLVIIKCCHDELT